VGERLDWVHSLNTVTANKIPPALHACLGTGARQHRGGATHGARWCCRVIASCARRPGSLRLLPDRRSRYRFLHDSLVEAANEGNGPTISRGGMPHRLPAAVFASKPYLVETQGPAGAVLGAATCCARTRGLVGGRSAELLPLAAAAEPRATLWRSRAAIVLYTTRLGQAVHTQPSAEASAHLSPMPGGVAAPCRSRRSPTHGRPGHKESSNRIQSLLLLNSLSPCFALFSGLLPHLLSVVRLASARGLAQLEDDKPRRCDDSARPRHRRRSHTDALRRYLARAGVSVLVLERLRCWAGAC